MIESSALQHFATVLLVLGPVALGAQAPEPPSDSTLASITARGRLLAAYDRAAWRGTDAMLARLPNPAGVEGYLARQDDHGAWSVVFGRLTAAKDSFLIAVTAAQQTRDSFSVLVHSPARAGSDAELRSFRALYTAGADLQAGRVPHQGTYNSYVLPGSHGEWLIYFLPAQTHPSVIAHGGDFRYVVSADGLTIVSKLQMHNTVLTGSVPADAVAGVHTVVTADVPQDSDVFLVLTRRPLKPEVIGTEHFHYQIHTDGRITWRRGERERKVPNE